MHLKTCKLDSVLGINAIAVNCRISFVFQKETISMKGINFGFWMKP